MTIIISEHTLVSYQNLHPILNFNKLKQFWKNMGFTSTWDTWIEVKPLGSRLAPIWIIT